MNDAEDGDGDEHFRRAFDEIKSQGQRVASSMEKRARDANATNGLYEPIYGRFSQSI